MPCKNHANIQTRIFMALCKILHPNSILSEPSPGLEGWLCTHGICISNPEQIDVYNNEIRITIPPSGFIEILSPTQTLTDLTDKAVQYFELCIKSCWLVLPTLKNHLCFQQAAAIPSLCAGRGSNRKAADY